ncbi:SpaA isopeptide-forming pilin-related protein [Coprococcus eutactus]|uniref:SpaA isopeptide-forming pilin-related protein n=1 Tax=Coprococcus eutactus TaxID=33043 RepID=UPI001D07F785|nr:VaFE repeat-containing surface-anchored protein [Coprococcus eutactus]MCB6628409.1 VaFE repeat-containing surface-anchored protein [Coprococcus eutactus]MCG4789280.1 VaFE repeat-containing surface-anchored protein [Coprococcus eutactus]MCQ5118257.1 VaFE repeat-containing surface-anchored protein [Coprococcus eutactus]MCQ5131895.1 VaFE repeat-containing surface-anchored protein [Coprococcus eutactus]MCQ5135632.1 VaFE repeat-containing surface-anchored protein [Coprococcus eutactus]
MFKDKVKVTVVALVMVLLMVLSITTDLFVGLADIFRAKAEEATPTDATPVTRDVTVYKELNDSDKDRNLAGAVIKVFKDSACAESITEFVLSYDGKSYGGDDRVVYKSLEERANANASKAIAKLQEDTYYYQLDKKLFRSNDDYSKTGYDYNNTVGSFSVVAGDGVQEIKLDNNMFRPTEKVTTPTDASSEVSTEVTTETTTEPDTQVATTSDASSEETETTTQVATPTDSIPEAKPVATLASVFRMAKAATTTAVSRGTGYGYGGGTISYIFYINKGLTYNNTGYAFCMEEGKTGPTSGTGTVSSIGKSNITKALYYSFAGPGAGSYGGAPSSGGLNGNNVMALSCILNYYYTGYWDSGDFGAAYDDAILYEKWLKGKDMPNTLADTAFSIAGKSDDFTASRAAYNITDKTQTTNEWAVVSKKSVTVTIPTGVTMHKTDSNGKKSTHGAGTATVSNGDKIYFSASVAKGGTSTVKFTSVKGYSAYKADFGAELQVLGFSGKPTDKEFTAKLQWNSPNFSLKKTDSKTKQPVEGAEYLVYCAQDNEKVNVVRFKTNSNGVGEITSVNSTQASGEVGKTVVKLKAGVRYYIVETKAPEHYKLNKNKQIAIGGEKYPYEAHIGVNATDGHVDYTSITGATFSTTATGVTYHTVDKVAHDPINIVIDKVDSIREDGTQVGKTSLAGAIFRMEYYQGKTTASGTPTNTWYIKTVKNAAGDYTARFAKGFIVNEGAYKSDAAPDTLQGDTYELEDGAMRITEVKAPSGYKVVDGKNKGFFYIGSKKVTGQASITVRVAGGKTILAGTEISAEAFKQYEQKERYDFKLKKVDSYGNPMAGVAFLVTASNGDQHVVVTDKNGEFDSSKMGYTNVNGNDATLAKAIADTTLYPTYKETNVFFTTPGSGKTAAAEIKEETVDGKAPRPLYKDTYTIREIHRQYVTIDGKKYKLTQVYDLGPAQKITVSDSAKNGAVIDFGTYTNTAIPKMTSSAISTDTNTKMSVAGKNASFKDSIKATNLKASTKYTLMSVAVDANTGKAYKDADGKYVAKNVAVTTGAVKKGTVFPETTASVTFTGVNTSNVKSRKLVFYEYLVEGSVTKTVSLDSNGKPVEPANCVAKDASTSNEAQTVNVISLETKVLVNSTKTNESPAAINTVTDTVTTHGLIAGESFTINSTIKVDGKSIGVQSTDFTAEGNDKEVSVVFKDLDLSKLANKRLSIVTELIYKNSLC